MKTSTKKIENVSVKNVNTDKKIVNLNDATTKEKFVNAKKESIKNGIDLNSLDFLNLETSLKNVNVTKSKNVNERHFIYKFERDGLDSQKAQSKRTKIRKQINSKIDNIIFYAKEKDKDNLEKSVKEFKEFYLETYILNDYSLNSIYANHVEQIKKDKLSLAFKIIALIK